MNMNTLCPSCFLDQDGDDDERYDDDEDDDDDDNDKRNGMLVVNNSKQTITGISICEHNEGRCSCRRK